MTPITISAAIVASKAGITVREVFNRLPEDTELVGFLPREDNQEVRVFFGNKETVVFPQEKTFPPVTKMVGNALGAAGRAVKQVVRGGALEVSTEVYEQRLDTCRGCEQYDIRAHRCARCGCNTEFKLRLTTEKCPLDKWGAVTE